MGVFIVLLGMPVLLQCLVFVKTQIDFEKKNKRALMFFFIMLALLLILRHEDVGSDTESYVLFFRRVCYSSWSELKRYAVEPGFLLLGKTLSLISANPQFFLGTTALIIIFCMRSTYMRLCIDPSLTIMIFCNMPTFVMMFSGIRQMMAIAIGFLAYEFTCQKKWILFILMVCLALTFHASAFMLLFMYPLYHVRVTKNWLFAVIPVLTLIFLFNEQIFSFLVFILSLFTEYGGEITETGAYTMLVLFIIFAVFSFVVPDESRVDEETNGLRNFLLLSCAIQLFAPLHTLATRMNYYYIIFIPLLLPKIISCSSDRWKTVASFARYVMLVVFFVYFCIQASKGIRGLNVFPYHFFWEEF